MQFCFESKLISDSLACSVELFSGPFALIMVWLSTRLISDKWTAVEPKHSTRYINSDMKTEKIDKLSGPFINKWPILADPIFCMRLSDIYECRIYSNTELTPHDTTWALNFTSRYWLHVRVYAINYRQIEPELGNMLYSFHFVICCFAPFKRFEVKFTGK